MSTQELKTQHGSLKKHQEFHWLLGPKSAQHFKETIRNLKVQHNSVKTCTTRSPGPTTFQGLTVFIIWVPDTWGSWGEATWKSWGFWHFFFSYACSWPSCWNSCKNKSGRINLQNNIPGGGQAAKGREERKAQHSKNNTEFEIKRPLIWGYLSWHRKG